MPRSMLRARPTRLGRQILRQVFDARHESSRPHVRLAESLRQLTAPPAQPAVINPPA